MHATQKRVRPLVGTAAWRWKIPAAKQYRVAESRLLETSRVAESQLPQTSGINPAFKPGVLGCAWGCVQKPPAIVGGWVGVVVAVLLEGPAN